MPAALPPLPKDAPNNRLGLARWLVDPANPLTARVTVNRYWQTVLRHRPGQDQPRTSASRANRPAIPELLDWLAVEFMQHGWDMKALHRLIVTERHLSAVVARARRPCSRRTRTIACCRAARACGSARSCSRDQALALSGLLVEKIGGPPVRPYQPPGIWEEFSFNQIKYVHSLAWFTNTRKGPLRRHGESYI